MSFLLANLFAPTAAPGAAGGVVGAAGQGNTGAFAEALKAFRASAPEGTGEAGAVIPGQALGLQVQGAPQTAPGSAQPKTTAQTLAALSSQLNIDPAILQRVQAGTATPEDIETLKAALVEAGVVKPSAEIDAASTDETATAAGVQTTTPIASVQAQTATPQTDPQFAAAPEDNVEMALRIADEKRPYVPPRPDLTPTTTDTEKPVAPLSEGRASTAAAPAPTPATTEPAKGAGAAKDLLAAALPRATAAASAAASASAAGTAKSDTPPPPQPAVPPVAAQTPIPQAAQAIASSPHVTSIQIETVTPAATAETPSAPGAAQAKPEIAASTPAPAATPEPAPEIKVAANSTEADAANAALSVLTKDETEKKPAAAQPQKTDAAQPQKTDAAPPAVKTQEGEAAKAPETPVAKPVNGGDEATKKDVKPEIPAPEKPLAAEKPAAPEPRAPNTQVQAPAADRPILMDTALRAVQQMQNLPAAAIPQIAGEMAARARQGATRFEIRLDPPELGRVDVRIEVDSDGRVHSRLMVEKSETLDLLKADQRALERALHDAGFKSEQNSLSFSLRDERGGQAKYDDQRFQREMNVPTAPAEEEPARLAAELAYRAPVRGAGGIDMRV